MTTINTRDDRPATARVTKLAAELGIPLGMIYATGAGGRIRTSDVRSAAAYYREQAPQAAREPDDVLEQLYGSRPEPTLSAEQQENYDAMYGSEKEPQLSDESEAIYAAIYGR